MIYEKSCGVIVFTGTVDDIRFLLVKSRLGVYGFPKGHIEGNENEIETALREVYEETGIKPRLVKGFKTTDKYVLPTGDITKFVTYFLGEFNNQQSICQRSEILETVLVTYSEALNLFEFLGHKRILKEAHDFLCNRNK